jgi:branched-chain amino acid transport system ATP-binding protein
MPTSDAALALDGISVSYGRVEAVNDVTLRVQDKQVVALLGPNGAGKSTVLKAVSGVTECRQGNIFLYGDCLDRVSVPRRARRGVVHVPEGRRIIAPLSVMDNLLLAARASGLRDRQRIQALLEEVFAYFPKLKERRNQTSGLMSGGEQQMLAIGRGVMATPRVLMLDEPSMGLAPIVIEEIYEILRHRQGALAGCSILLAEQSAALALDVADYVYVLRRGAVIAQGEPASMDQARMAESYLGGQGT